jgi:NADH-quinone oxidoreductase subunit J
MPESLLFYVLSGLAVGASALVIGQRNPMYSVLLLIVSFAALAGLYIGLDAPFVAMAQMIIYAGAIMVLFLFVVMLLNAGRELPPGDPAAMMIGPTGRRLGVVLSILFGLQILWALSRVGVGWLGPADESISSVRNIGRSLFTDHAFAFEATSILILVAMVGAVLLARREGDR